MSRVLLRVERRVLLGRVVSVVGVAAVDAVRVVVQERRRLGTKSQRRQ